MYGIFAQINESILIYNYHINNKIKPIPHLDFLYCYKMSLFCFKFPSRIPYFAYLLCLYRVSLVVTVYIDFSLFLMTLTLLRCTGQVSYRMSLNWGWSRAFLMGGLELRILEREKLVEIICHFQVAQTIKNLPARQETWVWSLGWEESLEKWKVTHSSILAWRILWTV